MVGLGPDYSDPWYPPTGCALEHRTLPRMGVHVSWVEALSWAGFSHPVNVPRAVAAPLPREEL